MKYHSYSQPFVSEIQREERALYLTLRLQDAMHSSYRLSLSRVSFTLAYEGTFFSEFQCASENSSCQSPIFYSHMSRKSTTAPNSWMTHLSTVQSLPSFFFIPPVRAESINSFPLHSRYTLSTFCFLSFDSTLFVSGHSHHHQSLWKAGITFCSFFFVQETIAQHDVKEQQSAL